MLSVKMWRKGGSRRALAMAFVVDGRLEGGFVQMSACMFAFSSLSSLARVRVLFYSKKVCYAAKWNGFRNEHP